MAAGSVRRRRLAVALVLCAAAGVAVYMVWCRGSAAPPDVPAAGSATRPDRRPPRPPVRAAVESPRWPGPETPPIEPPDAARYVREFALANGLHGVLYPTRARFPFDHYIQFRLELYGADGAPIADRYDLEAVVNERGPTTPRTKRAFVGVPEEPGVYELSYRPDASTPVRTFYQVIAFISDTGRTDNPGPGTAVATEVEYGSNAYLGPRPRGLLGDDSLDVTFTVVASEPTEAIVRAEIVTAAGTSIGEAVATGPVAAGQHALVMRLPVVGADLAGTQLLVEHAVLWTGPRREWTDFWTMPIPLTMSP